MKYELKGLQLEITTKCSFNCSYCPRRSFKDFYPMEMNPKVLNFLSPYFPELKRIALYGYGEPTEADLEKFLKEIRKEFDGEIVLVTNGSRSLLPYLKYLSPGLLAFSVDSVSKEPGIKNAGEAVLKNLRKCSEESKKRRLDLRIGAETVLMKRNLEEIPKLIDVLRRNGASFVEITNLIPYFDEMISQVCYLTISEGVFRSIFGKEKEMIRELDHFVYVTLKGVYSEEFKRAPEVFEEFIADGYLGANPHLLAEFERLGILRNYFEAIRVLSRLSKFEGIEIRAPRMIPDAKARECPYLSKGFLYVRSDGKVAPCMEFSYSHPVWVNGHWKGVREVILGDLSSFEEILRSGTLTYMCKLTSDFSSIPWCGDCPYSTMGCWYLEKNEIDCLGNSPSCSECLYSVGITKCLI